MRVVWSKQSLDSLREISKYLLKEFGVKSSARFLGDVKSLEKLLSLNPELGHEEVFLSGISDVLYRSILLNAINKIVYIVKDDTIEILAIWDTRREPKMLKNLIQNNRLD